MMCTASRHAQAPLVNASRLYLAQSKNSQKSYLQSFYTSKLWTLSQDRNVAHYYDGYQGDWDQPDGD